ncbi:ribonuclease P protein subunit rpr2 isoform X2 [Chelonus insularis]|uniref:ribonuclease P protein subunit rpr2 isoform X2 n=1 Tax=Chelonus insularis TaxID=460826 RepID=UPI00158DD51C|nr:ribonuclease P protein subunit rpr2 isoform X2 [Chelonus insularis]
MSQKSCNFRGKPVFERMNFLYQASQIMAKIDPVASSFYGNAMINCAKKTVSKIEPDIKRTMCKSCQSPLVAGETARVRLMTKPIKSIKITCLLCKTSKRIVNKKEYKLWLECPESVVKILKDPDPSEKKAKNTNSTQVSKRYD